MVVYWSPSQTSPLRSDLRAHRPIFGWVSRPYIGAGGVLPPSAAPSLPDFIMRGAEGRAVHPTLASSPALSGGRFGPCFAEHGKSGQVVSDEVARCGGGGVLCDGGGGGGRLGKAWRACLGRQVVVVVVVVKAPVQAPRAAAASPPSAPARGSRGATPSTRPCWSCCCCAGAHSVTTGRQACCAEGDD
ncbi:hypothetical protein E2C01_017016 [Portunus trituberculatus]|uniref:Uncharacterized protein n=1 Tax=Portunus trituberculatus TaxID=210409 RepID=A0A5B7DS13_PORTR|nr:hypothetical protein [Portunus trituberculatus]